MKKQETARVIPFAGELSYDLTGQEPALEIFKVLWESATEFAMINLVPVITEDSGKEKRRSFQHAFACFPALQPAMTQAMWASEWPGTGTISPPFRLLISGKTRRLDFERMFDEHSSVFWTKYGGWEDLMLFSKGALMFYVCSHERFGSIFGGEALFQRIGLKGRKEKLENFTICGVEMDMNERPMKDLRDTANG